VSFVCPLCERAVVQPPTPSTMKSKVYVVAIILSALRFNVSVPVLCVAVDVLLESDDGQTWRLHHMTKACVRLFWVDRLLNVLMCDTEQ